MVRGLALLRPPFLRLAPDDIDGRILTKRVDYPLGNAKNRLKDSELEGKFHSLADAKIGKQGADRVVEAGWKLDEAKDVTTLMKLCEVRG